VLHTVWPLEAIMLRGVQIFGTCTERAPCTPAPQFMRHRNTLVKLYRCTKFGVSSGKFPEIRGPHEQISFTPLAGKVDPPRDRTLLLDDVARCRARHLRVSILCLHSFDLWRPACCFCTGPRGGTWHVPRGADRPATGAIVVPPLRRTRR